MNEDYVSYKLALKLKECGFDEPCRDFYWTSDGTFKHTDELVHKNSLSCGTMVAAPLLYHAQKWLREKKGIDVLVYNCACGYLWEVSKATNGTGLILFDEKGDDENSGCWTSYECALSAGISAALELIKKGE